MTFNDILALAKQGYKPADIKELLALNTDQTDSIPEEEHLPSEEAPEIPAKETEQPEEKKEDAQPEPDYKALYEKSQKELKAIQKSNTSKDVSNHNTLSDEEILLDFCKNL